MERVLEQLMARRPEFLAFLRKQGAGEAQAEDILQTALLRGLEPWTAAPAEDAAVPWFYRVLRNALIDHHRRGQAADRAIARFAQEPADEPSEGEPRRVCRCAYGILPAMKREYADLIEQVDVGGLSIEEVAAKSSITPNNAYVRLHRARKALRERLESACGKCATGGGRCGDCYCEASEV